MRGHRIRPRRGALPTTSAGLFAFCALVVAASAGAQWPSVEGLLATPLHRVRGRLVGIMVHDPDPRLGIELDMPTSIDPGSFDAPRDRFELHPVDLPAIRLTWPYGHAIDEALPDLLDRTEYSTAPYPAVTRGDDWIARIEWWTSSVDVRVAVRHATRIGPIDCVGSGGAGISDDALAARVRDWLLARCRSVRIVPLP